MVGLTGRNGTVGVATDGKGSTTGGDGSDSETGGPVVGMTGNPEVGLIGNPDGGSI